MHKPGNFELSYVFGKNIWHVNIEASLGNLHIEGSSMYFFRFRLEYDANHAMIIEHFSLSALVAHCTAPNELTKCPLVVKTRALFGAGALTRRRSRFVSATPGYE